MMTMNSSGILTDAISSEDDNNKKLGENKYTRIENNSEQNSLQLDGNGNPNVSSDEENEGVLLMVSCETFLKNSEYSDVHDNENHNNEAIENLNTKDSIAKNEKYELSTWTYPDSAEPSGFKELELVEKEESVVGEVKNEFYYAGISTPCRHRSDQTSEPIHMTLEEVKTSLQRLYGKQSGLTAGKNCGKKSCGGPFHRLRYKKQNGEEATPQRSNQRKSFPSALKETFCSWFKKGRSSVVLSKSSEELSYRSKDGTGGDREKRATNLLSTPSQSIPSLSPFANRALPPLPMKSKEQEHNNNNNNEVGVDSEDDMEMFEPGDFTSSIHKVKDYGWYWGPISGETAEKLLSNEPDGSFIVRDSSDEHYIFSLTFKLNGLVRHVRIEHDQGNFSFGTFTNFRSHTIVGFIENAVEHSRSGRYLFFLHRRPLLGPMRVQLLHPVSRFKQVQSLQHMCRFIILKAVRRDLITHLPLPRRLKEYLNTAQYYTEEVENSLDLGATRIPPVATPEQHLLLGDLSDSAIVTSVR